MHAAFQGFTFEMVARALPSVWDLIEPAEAWRIRTETSGAAVEESTGEIERDRLASAIARRGWFAYPNPVGVEPPRR